MMDELTFWLPSAGGLIGAIAMLAGSIVVRDRHPSHHFLWVGSSMLILGMVSGAVGIVLLYAGTSSPFNPWFSFGMELTGFVAFLGMFIFGAGFFWLRLQRRRQKDAGDHHG